MTKMEATLTAYAEETMNILGSCGCLLVTGNIDKSNVMTIGWGLIGRLWSKPFFMVAVRPSRFTYELIEKTNEFTVNVPRRGMEDIVDYCGSVSGREQNKFKEKGLILAPSRKVSSPIISNCIIHYECKVSYKTRVIRSRLPKEILTNSYRSGNFHILYFGEILATYADENVKDNLPI